MADRHLNEGALGWVLTAIALIGGLLACGIAGYIGHEARNFDNHLAEF